MTSEHLLPPGLRGSQQARAVISTCGRPRRQGPGNPSPRNDGQARCAGIFGTGRNDGLNPLGAIELPEITDPQLRLLHDLWQTHRDGAPAPRLADLDVFDSPHWLGHLSLLETIEDGLHFRYLIYRRALAAYYGRDLSGKTTRDLSAAVGNLIRREYLQAYADQRPVLVERRRRVRGVSIMIAKLILPLSSDGRAIDLLLAGSYPHP